MFVVGEELRTKHNQWCQFPIFPLLSADALVKMNDTYYLYTSQTRI